VGLGLVDELRAYGGGQESPCFPVLLGEARGVHFSSRRMSANIVCPTVTQISTVCCVVSNKIDPKYMIAFCGPPSIFLHLVLASVRVEF